MRDSIETQHLDGFEFGIFNEESEETLTDPTEIESFIDENEPAVVAKALVDSFRLMFDDLVERVGQELVDCYNANRK